MTGRTKQASQSEVPIPSDEELERVRELCRAGVVRGKYKYLRVSVRDGRVRVSIPNRVSRAAEADFIEKHLVQVSLWLRKQKEAVRERRENDPLSARYHDGGRIAYLGKPLKIRCMPVVPTTRLACEGRELWIKAPLAASPELVQKLVLKWLLERFNEHLLKRLDYWTSVTGLHPREVKASNAKARWGSCTRMGVVRISWRTICLRPDVLDYVIVHELVHLKHFDHSQAFWQTVRGFFPECGHTRSYLKGICAQELA